MIPEDWELNSEECNLVNFLTSVFDHQLIVEENSKIAKSLSKMEHMNAQHELNRQKMSYKVVGSDMMCNVCKRKLDFKNVCIFPDGEAYHQRCVKNPHECPMTRQQFDVEVSIGARRAIS